MKTQLNIRRYWAALAIAVTLGIGILIGTVVSHGVHAALVAPPAPGAEPLSIYSPVKLSESFSAVAAKVSPAVVNINTESMVRFADKGPNAGPYGQFFNHFFHFGPDGIPHDMRQQSLGSGVILDSHGYVLTNYHVVMQDDGNPVDSIRVFLHDQDEGGRGYAGRIIGKDKWTDLAVIKIDASKPLPTAQLGDSNTMKVGDWVLAIGSPFGLSATVTAGIISAKGRQIEGGSEGEFKRFLQTDAAINPGNSGGPLVNMAAQVIGINTAIATTRGAYDGVGFAIPSRVVRRIYNSIITTGSVRRGAIGVSFVNNENAALLRSFGADHGVVVQSVEPGGPAERAGIQRGDVITAINAKPVHSGDDLLAVVSNTDPGANLRVGILRDRKPVTCNVVVGDWNKVVGAADGSAPESGLPSSPAIGAKGSLGVTVKDLGPGDAKDLSAQLHLPQPAGVMVVEVTPGSFADNVGLERFDVILSINHTDVRSSVDFDHLQSQLKSGQDVLLLIARRTGSKYSTLFLADQLP
ncbi:MAG TPA: trypsin-like peptidase domain-containing protein [Terriglobia bacterium]|nr:trypsin-like peptidase domain-containing protein [Terriglobia bacterium]